MFLHITLTLSTQRLVSDPSTRRGLEKTDLLTQNVFSLFNKKAFRFSHARAPILRLFPRVSEEEFGHEPAA